MKSRAEDAVKDESILFKHDGQAAKTCDFEI